MFSTFDQLEDLATRNRLSVVGIAKNCGKTTTLTTLLQIRDKRELPPPALVSVGIDGESEDALLGTDKPSIRVWPGQWVATAEIALRQSSARVEYVESTGVSTPLGDVYVCRVVEEGTMVLAGLGRQTELIGAVELLESLTDDPIWIDGAYDRLTAAHPAIARSVIVATGAVAGIDVADVVSRTRALVSRLELSQIRPGPDRHLFEDALDKGRPFVRDDGNPRRLEVPSAVTGLGLLEETDRSVETVAIPGLVSNRVAEELLGLGRGRLLVANPTVVQPDDDLWKKLRRRWEIRVYRGVEPIGISYNPSFVDGRGLDKTKLENDLREAFPGRVVFDSLPNLPRSI